MEKQRSFSWKSARFLLLFLTLSFSLVLFSFFSFWAVRSSSLVPQQSFLLTLNPLNLQSLAGPFADSSAHSLENANSSDTQFKKVQSSSEFVANSKVAEVNGVKDLILVDAHVRGGYNSSGFLKSSNSVRHELHSKGNVEEIVKANSSSIGNLEGAHLRGTHNSSGFLKSSNSVRYELQSKGNIEEIVKANSSSFSKVEGAHLRGTHNSSGFLKSSTSVRYELYSKGDIEEIGKANASSFGEVEQGIEKEKFKDCDVAKGRWVLDESYPLYTNLTCPFIDEGFNCQGNGKPDNSYMKWRWQPDDCHIPRFNATNMLELIRGKRLVFVGDSINRNQWESLLCLLMGAVKDPTKVYETRGRRITKERGLYSFRFVDYQCTVEFYVTHFLVHETKARIGRKRKETLRIDSIDKGSSRWRGADILIFNTGNWWSHFKTKAGINYYQEGKQVYPHLDALTAYRKAISTWAAWVDRHVNPHKTHVFFRSTTPAHFRGGQWNTGGHCREAKKPLDDILYMDRLDKDLITQEVISKMKTPVTFLNVTVLSTYRIDGHPSIYGRSPGKRGSFVEDCSHWCLPGVPDAWNELIYHQLLFKQTKKS